MAHKAKDFFSARRTLDLDDGPVSIYALEELEKQAIGQISQLPFTIKVLLEAALRQSDGFEITQDDVVAIAKWRAKDVER